MSKKIIWLKIFTFSFLIFLLCCPPPTEIPLIHKLGELYKSIYCQGNRISKRDRFGIHHKIENACLDAWELTATAAFEAKQNKVSLLNKLRVKIEILKRLIRLEHELNIFPDKAYINLERELQEISKMTNGWIKYLTQREPNSSL